jgi:hypothetical protein
MNDTIVNKDFHGIIAMLNERNDQIHKHGFTVENDVLHNPNGELIIAARALMKELPNPHDFPEHWGIAFVRKLMRKTLIERYIIAGALIAAEVDRKKYLEEKEKLSRKLINKYPLTPKEAHKIAK